MRTHLRHLRPLLLVLVAAVLVLTGCSDDSGDDESGSDADATSDDSASGDAGGSASGDAVTIADFAFDPDGLTVAAGTTVTFTNEDSAAHTATAEDDSFDTGELEGGDSAEVTFDEPGEVSYFCNIHNYMQGTVTVE
jgi:plastocyanin